MARLLLVLMLAAGAATWWWHDDARRWALAHAPALAAYLPQESAAKTNGARPAPPAVPVVVATADRRAIPVTIDAVGTVQPIASIQIKSRLDSQVVAIAVKEGARVKEGDLLVRLDGRALQAQLAQAEAIILKDQAQIEQARRDLSRAEDLLAKRITTEVQRDTAATLLKVQQAQLGADKASRDNLATLLGYTEIRAPISGRIGSIALKLGSTVKALDTVAMATINQIDPIFVSFAVPQTLFGELRTAMAGHVPVTARVGAATVEGQLAFVENSVDLATGTILAKAEMANGDERLWPGAFVSVQATLGRDDNAVAVPSSAIQIGQKGPYLFVIRNDKATLTPVAVARTVGGDSVISDGLSGGEQVVVDGQLRLVDGARVQVRPAQARSGVAAGESTPPSPRRS